MAVGTSSLCAYFYLALNKKSFFDLLCSAIQSGKNNINQTQHNGRINIKENKCDGNKLYLPYRVGSFAVLPEVLYRKTTEVRRK